MAEVSQSTVSARRGGGPIHRTVRSIAMFAVALVVASAAVVSTGVLPASAASTGPGSLDTSFNPGGAGANGQVSSMVVQSDGKVLIVGDFTSYNGASVGRVARVNVDGSLDTTFNSGGAGANYQVSAVVVQSNGKILIGGGLTTYNGTSVGRIARLNADGSLDTTFNPGDVGANGMISSIIVLSNDKILVGGAFTTYNGMSVGRLARLNTDGSLDTAFNSGGTGASDMIFSMVVQPDGRAVIGGWFVTYNGAPVGRVARLNADGSLDSTFNPTGTGTDDTVNSVGVQPDGKLVISGGFTTYNGASMGHVARLNTDGSLDTTFNSGGSGADDTVTSVSVQPDGKLVMGGGFTRYDGTPAGYIARLNADGSLDSTFNSGGSGANSWILSVLVQPDGKLLIAGFFTNYDGTSVGYVARLNASSAVYTVSFDANGGSGSMASQSASSATALTANTFTRSGYTFAGWNTAANGSGTAYADGASFPFTADATLYAQWAAVSSTGPGSLDTSFNAGGAGANNIVSSVVVRPDGKVLIAGAFTSYDGTSVGSVARLNADGSLDTSFNSGGAGADDAVYSVVVQSDRKILISGAFTSYDGTSVGHVARLNADGSLDTSFNSGGAGTDGKVSSVVVQSDGKVLICGQFSRYNGISVGSIARLNADGSLDTSFNTAGAGANNEVNSAGVQSDGKILIGGWFTRYNGASVGYVARLNADGSLDASFNSGGVGAGSGVYSVVVQSDGKVLIGGFFTGYNGTSAGRVARLNADGSLDASFNSGGAGASGQVYSVALQSDGKVLIGGLFTSYDGTSVGHFARLSASAAVYTVSFDANDGSGSMVSQSASSATALTANAFTRSGYTFSGWNTAADGSGTAYADGASFPFTANATLYGQWAAASSPSTTAGALDTTFNSGGSGASDGQVSSMVVQSDGKILIAGTFVDFNGTAVGRIARLNADGSLDASFNAGGAGVYGQLYSVAVQSDGKVLIAGGFPRYNSTPVSGVARLNADGSLDASFNSNGAGASGQVYSLLVQSDGKVLIGGDFTRYNGTSVIGLARLNADGSLDTTFNASGAGTNGRVHSMVVLSDGKMLIGGGFTTYNHIAAGGIARLNADGSLDTTFNPSGAGIYGQVNSISVLSDSKILIGGQFTSYNGTSVGRVARLNADGSLDASFNPGGVGADDFVIPLRMQSDGKILIGGQFTSYNGTSVGRVARLNADGSLDASFNPGGIGANWVVSSVVVQSNEKTLIGGGFSSYNGTPVGHIARLGAVSHTVSFDANGGSGSMAAQSASAATALTANTLTRSGYTFAGWNTAADGSGTAYADGAVFPFTANATLYAQWAAVSHTVSFDANGGAGSMAAQSASAATALTANTLTRSGYTFTGWNTAADGSGTAYADGASFPFTANATLYAQWAVVSHTVSFDANGGSGSMAAQSASSATALTANTLTRSGYTFAGWNTAADGSGTAYADGAVFPFTADATLYAQWAAVASPVPSATLPQLQVTLGLALGQPVTGGAVDMSATGLLPGSSWQAVVRSTPVTMAVGTVLSDGTFTSSGVLPGGLEAGTHSVTLTATSALGAPVSSVVWFQVSAAGTLLAVTTDSSVAAAWVLPTASLAITGSDSVDGLLLATSLLLAGGLLLVLRRRRRATA